jgi:tetratricopeptide (TPR) repeat protein
MSRPFSFLLAAVLLLAVASCAAHEKAGDRAAAVGDWKTAEREYGAAARKDPSKRELQEKYAQARAGAIEGSSRAATACYAARDFECAFAEASYALSLDPGRVDLATLRRDAGREAAFLRVSRAREASGRGDHRGALGLLLSAREASDDPAVTAEIRRAAPGVVDGAIFDAEALRAKEQYPQALELYTAAAQLDPAVQPRLAAVQAEYERWKDSEAERLAQQGDGLLAERRYAEAKAAYDAAVQLRPRGRAEPLARYAGLLTQGEAAIGARDFVTAERAFAEASRYPGDRVAAEELDRVKVRPWAIRLDSVLVTPTRPDGWPWSGSRSFLLDRILAQLQRAASSASASVALDLARRVPRDNQPNLVVTVGLPDGRGLQTAPRRGVHLALDGSFVVASNAYDDRQLSLRVVHEDARGGQAVDVGVVTFRLGDLVAQRELAVSGGSVTELRLAATASSLPDGAFAGLQPIPDGTNHAPAWSVPAAGAVALRLVNVEGILSAADRAARAPGTAAPSLTIELEQRGRVVYRSPPMPGRTTVGFTPVATYLFVAPRESIVVRLLDGHPGAVVSGTLRGDELQRLGAGVSTPGGSTVRLRLEPRRAGPDAPQRTAQR